MNKRTVTMLSPYFAPYRGGIENYVKHLSEELSKRKWNVRILASSLRGTYDINKQEYRATCYHTRFHPLNNPISLEIIQCLLGTRTDIIHVNGYYQTVAIIGALFSKIRGKPAVLTVHGRPTYDGFILKSCQNLYERSLAFPILRSFDYVVVMNRSDYDFILSMKYPRDRVKLIPNAVDVDYWSPSNNSSNVEYGDREDFILYVGAFNRRKNVTLLVKAFSDLPDCYDIVRLVLVGSGPEQGNIVKLVRKMGLEKRVDFLCDISRDDLRALYRKARMFVLPSKSEGLPTVLLEAMSTGTPAVASDIPGARDVITNRVNGYLFDHTDIQDLVNSVCQVLEADDKIKRVVRQARSTICSKFSWEHVAGQIDKLYRSLMP